MNSRSTRSVESKIARLSREIAEIDESFYGIDKNGDRSQYAGMLERKRDDVVRSAVLQMHTAIEDLLNSHIVCHVLNVKPEDHRGRTRGRSARALRKMLFGAGSLGFDMKLNFAVALVKFKVWDLVSGFEYFRKQVQSQLASEVPVRRGRRPAQKKPPLLLYKGRDLHNVAVLKEFVSEYGIIYLNMFAKYLD